MIDDFRPRAGRKPKVIHPLAKPARAPLPIFDEEISAQEPVAAQVVSPGIMSFDTPKEQAEQIGEPETLANSDKSTNDHDIVTSHPKPQKTSWKTNWKPHVDWPPTKKQLLIMGGVALLIITLSSTTWVLTHRTISKADEVVTIHHKTEPKPVVPKTVASTLSGLQVDPAVNLRPVTGVMIENSTDARPQSGLSQANVVFEAVAEGGVTRFLALFQDTAPDNIGPVRSARPYYIEWALGFDAGYAHVGGSPDGLADIKAWHVRDLDQFANSSSYHRISTREAPHNVYTSVSTLNQLEATKGYTSSKFTGFARKPEAPAKTPTVTSINLTLSGPVYNAHYDYVAATNSYNRSEGGSPQTDANTNAQISPKVVVAMVITESQGALDSSGAYYSNYNVVGSGPVDIFQDGTLTTGQWAKASDTSQITFTDAAGKPIALNPGQTWLTAITDPSKVTDQ
jgi:hypothetical protein